MVSGVVGFSRALLIWSYGCCFCMDLGRSLGLFVLDLVALGRTISEGLNLSCLGI